MFSHSIKPRPHQQQFRSNIVKCYKSNDSFDKVETNGTYSICLDFVDRTKFHKKTSSTLLSKPATKSNVASTLFMVWTGLKVNDPKSRYVRPRKPRPVAILTIRLLYIDTPRSKTTRMFHLVCQVAAPCRSQLSPTASCY